MAAAVPVEIALNAGTLPSAKVGQPWSLDLAPFARVTGAAASGIAWRVVEAPSWLSVDPATGRATGTPPAATTVRLSVEASVGGKTASQSWTVAAVQPSFEASIVAAGKWSTCAVDAGGAAWCWGGVALGSATRSSKVPIPIAELSSGVTAISVGSDHACAVKGGAAWCWGTAGYGQAGNGSKYGSDRPRVVAGLESGVTRIAARENHTCAVQSGAVKCFGYNYYKQVNPTTSGDEVLNPVQVGSLTDGVTEIALGDNHSCALRDGRTHCWGFNLSGQANNGSTSTYAGITAITAFGTDNVSVAVSTQTSCVLKSAGNVSCWGIAPAAAAAVNGASQLSLGGNGCAVRSGRVFCWGTNSYGALGNGTGADAVYSPVMPLGLESGVRSVSVGVWHACAVKDDGSTLCWGRNTQGMVGDGTVNDATTPKAVSVGTS